MKSFLKSGKSTLACSISRELHSRGKLSYILDGDNLRHGLNKDLGFKPEDRTENIRRVGKCLLKTKFWIQEHGLTSIQIRHKACKLTLDVSRS